MSFVYDMKFNVVEARGHKHSLVRKMHLHLVTNQVGMKSAQEYLETAIG